MNEFPTMTKWLFAGVFLVFCLGGCAWIDRFFGEDIEKSPAELMNDGIENMERGRYSAATEAFQNLKDRYPYSKFAVTAELKMADTLYKRELYDEAFDAYDEFERLHPKNSNIAYVIYQKGMCHFSQVSTIDRDQSNTHAAKEQFERLVKKFPRTEYTNKARRKIRQCYINLAEYELYVGHFYFKMKKYRAAMGRYRYLLENYPDLGQYQEALEYLSKCKDKLTEKQENS
jgi:outer membrane protein assembly factor BamD